MRLSVLLFNAGSDNEGIYTLAVEGQNTVVAFEDEDDATRYALLLEAQDFLSASVEVLDEKELQAFCESADLGLSIIEKGTLAVPPDKNLDQLDWSAEAEVPDAEEPDAPLSELDLLRQRLEKLL
ncbi:DUF3110 domain-containing protein [Anthocerotibacter panamensis]|uniref:DUF3110 domain-containing protein n=1 Tax=Anthocerotibacter panamensis TaxID=2857077 RepID=UPI001C401743|nr:DUF3110 domain-containing protein [Anthocerotibacter panamensis]